MFSSDGESATELGSLPLERLEHEIEQLASHLTAGTCRWLELVAEFDRREGWGSWGCRSCAHWVAWRCALSLRSAREHVRVARRLDELPQVHTAFREGRLSYSKVRALTRVATEESETDLMYLATHATAGQLDKLVRTYRRVSTAEANDARAERYLTHFWEDDGSLSIHARLPAEDGALFLAALEASRDELRERAWAQLLEQARSDPRDIPQMGEKSGSAEPPLEPRAERAPEPWISRADALTRMAEASLEASPARGLPGGERNQLVVHVDLERLQLPHPAGTTANESANASAAERPAEDGRCHLRDGPGIAPETARRLACDASAVAIGASDGETVSVSRRTRTIPPSIRRALHARDGGCRFPGCDASRFTDAHHVQHWADGGKTSLDNLILLCRTHHRLLHEGGFRLIHRPGGELAFQRPDGREVAASPLARPGRPEALAPGAGLLTGSGEPMDLDYTLPALFSALEPDATARAP